MTLNIFLIFTLPIGLIVIGVVVFLKKMKQSTRERVTKELEQKQKLQDGMLKAKEDLHRANAALKAANKKNKTPHEMAREFNIKTSLNQNSELEQIFSQLKFPQWLKWKNRNTLNGGEYSGIYMLGHFIDVPSGYADPLSRRDKAIVRMVSE